MPGHIRPVDTPQVDAVTATTTVVSSLGAYSAIEAVVKLASLAYAAGFLTILIQTGPLGIPVLDLFQAMTILAGIPIVLTLALLAWLVRLFVSQYRTVRLELTKSSDPDPELKCEDIERAINVTASFVLPITPITGAFARIVAPKLFELILNSLGDKHIPVRRLFARGYALLLLWRLLLFINNFAIVVILMWIWVCVVYPNIPQSWGGGQPMSIRLAVESEKIPANEDAFR